MEGVHQREHRNQRHRHCDSNDHRATRATQEQDQHDKDESDTLEHGVGYLLHGRLHQFVAIDVWDNLYILQGQLCIELIDLRVNAY